MTTKTKVFLVLGAVAVLVVGFAIGAAVVRNGQTLGASSFTGGALIDSDALITGNIFNGRNGTLVSSNGVLVGNASSTSAKFNSLTLSGGTAVTKFSCATTTWNPGSVGTSSVNAAATSTDLALSGSVLGDTCSASLTSATTSAASVNCFITGTATATVRLLNLGSTALDLATGTVKACYTH